MGEGSAFILLFTPRKTSHHKIKKGDTGRTQIRHIKRVLNVAGKGMIAEAEIEDFFDALTVGNRTKKNYLTVLHNFFKRVVRREKRKSRVEMPEFPDISFTLS